MASPTLQCDSKSRGRVTEYLKARGDVAGCRAAVYTRSGGGGRLETAERTCFSRFARWSVSSSVQIVNPSNLALDRGEAIIKFVDCLVELRIRQRGRRDRAQRRARREIHRRCAHTTNPQTAPRPRRFTHSQFCKSVAERGLPGRFPFPCRRLQVSSFIQTQGNE